MSRAILITGATGKQGGAVLDALLRHKSSDLLLLAVTRNAQSASARRIAAKSPSIRIVEGDLDAAPTLFASAKASAGTVPLWGVFSVQAMADRKSDEETQQGKAMIDESIKAGVQHFVYSSVERGGDEHSWNNPTHVPHFITKHRIEHHLRDSTADNKSAMGWTILRPVIFMDNLAPGFFGKVFLTMIRDVMGQKPLQWIATKDIGFFAAEAFRNSTTWNKKAIGLAGDELTFSQLSQTFKTVTGEPVGTTFGVLGKALKHGVQEVGIMVDWFKEEGYKANMAENKRIHPDVMSMEKWLKESAFVKKQ
ncbi:nucleoside-diphosphate-sugar epimerase family protein [Verticillium dahliae VdLs.17]|uniref:Nucleoside-diphosphate-sugar epimerase family protein n=1 Tax=Verticillium dahliae (strain VdLs.17 / ATCC MYA-4575 / FGSC 10137) TaxID=498257 RepID=G2WXQ0_VERDV|nr:nucleoside-diphosphate-sugar epimerase family protein [Verticillium dahliae VdLs.17]EGY20858.1 nucleoside-diphosphate-sugar epimerase family protein [Verticillium dahliae VdLs.17]